MDFELADKEDESMSEALLIDARFNGPPQSGNGGYCAGLLAERLARPVEVTLRAPPPLETPLRICPNEGGADIMHGETLVMEARDGAHVADVPPSPGLEAASRGPASYPGPETHSLSTCFVCGPGRAPGDGLRIFAGKLDGSALVAAPWTPSADLAGEDGQVSERFLWAALDCPGAFALTDADFVLLGRMSARIDRRPAPGEDLLVIGWPTGSEGRKHRAGTAIYTAAGDLIAQADQTWIETRKP